MARLLMKAMAMGGHDVSVASELRSFLKQADDPARSLLADAATHEIETITERWQREGAPDLWFCYHPYYKAPDLLGPELGHTFRYSLRHRRGLLFPQAQWHGLAGGSGRVTGRIERCRHQYLLHRA